MKSRRSRGFEGALDALIADQLVSEGDVAAHRVMKEENVLGNVSDLLPPGPQVDLGQSHIVNEHLSVTGPPQPCDEVEDRTFPAAGFADQSRQLISGNVEPELIENAEVTVGETVDPLFHADLQRDGSPRAFMTLFRIGASWTRPQRDQNALTPFTPPGNASAARSCSPSGDRRQM